MTQHDNLMEQAKLGNIKAIGFLMNRFLKERALVATVDREERSLFVVLQGAEGVSHDKEPLLQELELWLRDMAIAQVQEALISLQSSDRAQTLWQEYIDLRVSLAVPPLPELPQEPVTDLEAVFGNDFGDDSPVEEVPASASPDLGSLPVPSIAVPGEEPVRYGLAEDFLAACPSFPMQILQGLLLSGVVILGVHTIHSLLADTLPPPARPSLSPEAPKP
jgi:hypothetical protein